MNNVKVTICGREYTLQTDEPGAYYYKLARELEKRITNFTDMGPSVSQFNAAILVGLSSLDDMEKMNERYDKLIEQAKVYVDEAGKSRIERDTAVRENEDLKRRVAELREEIKKLKATEENSEK